MKRRYYYNLFLFDPSVYKYIDEEFSEHLDTLKEIEVFLLENGSDYALFKTSSRLAKETKLFNKLRSFFSTFAPYLGNIPNYPTYQYDAHWNAKGNMLAAEFMAKLLIEHNKITKKE